MKRPVLLLSAALLLGACASEPLQTQEYLLRPDHGPTAPAADAVVVELAQVVVAPYLDQHGIVLLVADGSINSARRNVWAEPLNLAISRYLQVAISADSALHVEVSPLTTGAAQRKAAVRIHQLHGTVDGVVRLVAEWSVTEAVGSRTLHQFDRSRPQQADGYPALVATHAELLDALAEAIAVTLR